MRAGTLCFLTRAGPPAQVLLGLKKNGFGAGKYAGIGGKVEQGETVAGAAVRELQEEIGVRVAERDLEYVAHLTFLFPARPAWGQVVHVFRATVWEGAPVESAEMRPAWFNVDRLPFEQMWQDAPYWLPRILAGERVRSRFVFADDNETVQQVYGQALFVDAAARVW